MADHPPRKLKCFLSYRRKDLIVAGSIHRIYQRLERHFGDGHVFMDVDNIPPGADFREVLAHEVEQADVVLAVMGHQWAEFIAERAADPRDFVRIEIESALERDIPVIPLLIGGADVPEPETLPESIRELAFRNARKVDPGRDFDRNMERLIREMENHFRERVKRAAEKERHQREAAERERARIAAEQNAQREAQLQEQKRAAAAEKKRVPEAKKRTEAEARQRRLDEKKARKGNKKGWHFGIGIGIALVLVSAMGLQTFLVNPGNSLAPSPAIAEPVVNSLGMEFLPVPGLDGVLFSKWETRVQDYAAFAAETPGVDMESKDYEYMGQKQGPDHPVANVSWEDAVAFCEWLSKKEGKTYRLPTDRDWSVAVGIGGKESPNARPSEKDQNIDNVYPWGTQWPPPTGSGNFYEEDIEGYTDSFPFTAPVGSFQLEHHGIKDLSGNVWEWVEDKWEPSSSSRVLRGGSWDTDLRVNLLSSSRLNRDQASRDDYVGFRCVLGVEEAR